MSNQKNVFNLAETVLFGKKGNTKAKRETIRANYLAIVAAFKDIRTLFMYRDAPCWSSCLRPRKAGAPQLRAVSLQV